MKGGWWPSVQRGIDSQLSVVTGLPRPDRWVELRSGAVQHLLETARRAAERSLTNVAFERRDAEDLGPHAGFDVALCSLGLMYVPAPAVALAEMARVLRPGGRCVVAVWGERRNCGWAEASAA